MVENMFVYETKQRKIHLITTKINEKNLIKIGNERSRFAYAQA